MYEFRTRCSVADHYLFLLPMTSTTNLRQQARTPLPRSETTVGMAATLTTEAELKAWYLANNPTLRSQGLSCPNALYKEMQSDLRYYNTMVAIIPVIGSDDTERMVNELFVSLQETTNLQNVFLLLSLLSLAYAC